MSYKEYHDNIPNYDKFLKYFLDYEQLENVFETSKNINPTIATRMLDASGKPPQNLLGGNFYSLGSFDECYSIESFTIPDNIKFYGKYCLGAKIVEIEEWNMTQIFKMGYCIPSFVPAEQISGFYRFTEDLCYSKDTSPELTTGAVCAIVVLSLLLAVVAASTIYDTFLYYNSRKPSNDMLLSFSLITNCRNLFSNSTSGDQVTCLNGVKAISMVWIALGHHIMISKGITPNLFATVHVFELTKWAFVMSVVLAVDTFFVIGGLVNCFSFLKYMEKGLKFNLPMYCLHRFSRLLPIVAILVMINTFLTPYFGNGPFWSVFATRNKEICEKSWWTDLLFIGNYVYGHFCLEVLWYLAIDMQLFILSPLILLPLSKWRKPSLVGIAVLIVLGVVVPILQGMVSKIHIRDAKDYTTYTEDYLYKYFIKTHTRFGTYVIGILFGYLLHQGKKSNFKIRMSTFLIIVVWILCVVLLLVCMFAGYDMTLYSEYDFWATVWLLGVQRPLWSFALGTIILLCAFDFGGPINAFLSLPIFSFLTKLSYGMYLVHMSLMYILQASQKQIEDCRMFSLFGSFWESFMLVLAVSLLLFLMVESPLAIMYQKCIRKSR